MGAVVYNMQVTRWRRARPGLLRQAGRGRGIGGGTGRLDPPPRRAGRGAVRQGSVTAPGGARPPVVLSPFRMPPTDAPPTGGPARPRPGGSRSGSPALAPRATPPRAGGDGLASGEPRPGRSRRRRRSGSPYAAPIALTSLPTSREAYVDTREWLLRQHGSVCAYCGTRTDAAVITLDHVTPRRGQTAYDRRDNLVLACKRCNALKADTPILAFLLQRRERAFGLIRYGQHLSPMLLDLARQVAGPEEAARAERLADPDYPYAD